jgi:hypothetical protein
MQKRHTPVQKSNPNRPFAASVMPGGVGDNVVDGGQRAAAIGLSSYHNRLMNKELLQNEEETRTAR